MKNYTQEIGRLYKLLDKIDGDHVDTADNEVAAELREARTHIQNAVNSLHQAQRTQRGVGG